MSGELKIAGTDTGLDLYFRLSRGAQWLDVSSLSLETYDGSDYADYVVDATEQGATKIYVADMPAGSPAGRYDVFAFESTGTPTDGDEFASSPYSFYWNGTAVTDDPGTIDTAVALITLQDAKTFLNISDASYDGILSQLINGCSSWIAQHLGRELVSASRVHYFNGDGESDLILPFYPVTSITSIYEDSLRAWDSTSLVDSDDYIISKQIGRVICTNNKSTWTPGNANIKVTYVAGYTVGVDVPHGLRLAVKRIVQQHYVQGYTQGKMDLSSEGVGDATTTFRPDAIPRDVMSMIEMFRSYFPSPQFAYAD